MKPLEKARQDLEKAKKKREKMGISENQRKNETLLRKDWKQMNLP